MFAVIKTGGKQYRVKKDDVVSIERLEGEEGTHVHFKEVLMAGTEGSIEMGHPTVKKVVEGTIVSQGKGPKLFIQKFRRRKNSKTRTGHRQLVTKVLITGIKNA
jgi:large subunit ribosomal protein L21